MECKTILPCVNKAITIPGNKYVQYNTLEFSIMHAVTVPQSCFSQAAMKDSHQGGCSEDVSVKGSIHFKW